MVKLDEYIGRSFMECSHQQFSDAKHGMEVNHQEWD